MKYNINDIVMYGSEGVCRVSEISERKIGEEILGYYVLNPVYDEKSTVMVPLKNTALVERMRYLPTRDEALDYVKNAAVDHAIENDDICKDMFHGAIEKSDILKLLCVTGYLYKSRKTRMLSGKSLHAADERMLKDAERILFDTFAAILDTDRKSAAVYIQESLMV